MTHGGAGPISEEAGVATLPGPLRRMGEGYLRFSYANTVKIFWKRSGAFGCCCEGCSLTVVKLRRVLYMPGSPQISGKPAYAGGQPLCVVEQQNFGPSSALL